MRTTPTSLLLITQPDHAALAEHLIAAWRRDGIVESPRRETILRATRKHDDGWIEPDAAPIVDASTGRLLDFITAPDAIRQAIWPRAVERLYDDAYAAALVAEHAVSVFERYREIPAWDPFFARMDAMREDALRRASPRTSTELRRDYFFVRIGDLASLAFCNAWREPQRLADYQLQLTGDRLTIAPDPFDGHAIELRIPARQLPNRHYRSADDARREFEAAPEIVVTGVAAGPRS